jgi:hypothetical protein
MRAADVAEGKDDGDDDEADDDVVELRWSGSGGQVEDVHKPIGVW